MKDWRREGLADLARQGFMKPRPVKKAKAPPGPSVACALCADWHEAGKHRRWVWSIGADDEAFTALRPFVDTKAATAWAKAQAQDDSTHDRVVTTGFSPTEPGFRILARYERGSGARVS